MSLTYFQDTIFVVSPQLTAPGLGSLVEVAANDGFRTTDYTLIVVAGNLGGNTVTVRLDGSIDGTVFAPIIGDQTISTTDPAVFSVSGRPVKWVRPRFVSASGGTPTVDFQLAAA
jgi:hypothetical protein